MSLRVAVVGLDHYHVTGWVETLEGFADDLDIVALYDPDPERGRALAPTHHDPALRATLGERYRDVPFETRLDDLIARHRPDVALVTLPNADAPAAIETLAAAGVHLLIDKPGGPVRARDPARGRGRPIGGRPDRGRPHAPVLAALPGRARGRRLGRARPAARRRGGLRDVDGRGSRPGQSAVRSRPEWRRHPELARRPRHRCPAVADGSADRRSERDDRQRRASRSGRGRRCVGRGPVRGWGARHDPACLCAPGTRLPRAPRTARHGRLGRDRARRRPGRADAGRERGPARSADHPRPCRPPRATARRGAQAVADLLGAIREDRPTLAPIDLLVPALAVIDAAYESARTRHHVRLDQSGGTT